MRWRGISARRVVTISSSTTATPPRPKRGPRSRPAKRPARRRAPARAEAGATDGAGGPPATPAGAAKDADFVFCCVGNDNDLREVTVGAKGAFNTVRKGAVFIDNTTASANIARELHAAAKSKGFDFLDAPVSGGQAGAQNGALTGVGGGGQATS